MESLGAHENFKSSKWSHWAKEVREELLQSLFKLFVYRYTDDVIQTRVSRRSGFPESSLISCISYLTGISCGEQQGERFTSGAARA